MMLTHTSIGTLVTLVETRLATMDIVDREDKRERKFLQACLEELWNMRQAPGFIVETPRK